MATPKRRCAPKRRRTKRKTATKARRRKRSQPLLNLAERREYARVFGRQVDQYGRIVKRKAKKLSESAKRRNVARLSKLFPAFASLESRLGDYPVVSVDPRLSPAAYKRELDRQMAQYLK
jgi:hypothetical protein